MPQLPDPRRRRALYRASHRGTKEMDWLLGRYAASRLDSMSEEALAAFEHLLLQPDPELHAWLLAPERAPATVSADLMAEIRDFHNLHGLAR